MSRLNMDSLPELVAAAFAGIWIKSAEPEDVELHVARLANARKWEAYAWDCSRGVRNLKTGELSFKAATPIDAIEQTPWSSRPDGLTPVLLLLHNLHRFSDNPLVAQKLANECLAARREGRHLVAVSPVVRLPAELEKLFTLVEHDLPDEQELQKIAADLAQDPTLPVADGARAARGLTRIEAENALTLSLVRHQRLDPEVVWSLKAGALEKTQALKLHRGGGKFSDLVGLENLKGFCRRALRADAPERARGILLLGVPGTGKTAFAQALGNETGRPTLAFDMSALMSKYVGESEDNLRGALSVADAMAPCVLFVDEIEKALAGGASQDSGDSGVSRRLFGSLLTWLNDHTSDVFFVGTCNDTSRLPPEFARAERFDGVFFIDLPDADTLGQLWGHYIVKFDLGDDRGVTNTDGWTGAEVRSCCRIARMLGVKVEEAAQYVVPLAVSAKDRIEAIRDWASNRCLSADRPGRYAKPSGQAVQAGKALRRAVGRVQD